MDPASAAAADSLHSLLATSAFSNMYDQFASFLLPLRLHPRFPPTSSAASGGGCAAAPQKKRPKKKDPPAPDLRPLANRFGKFLCQTLKKLSSLCHPPQPAVDESAARELIAVYGLIVDCLWLISPYLQKKPSHILVYRCQMLRYLEVWGFYSNAAAEAEVTLSILAGGRELDAVCREDPDAVIVVVHVVSALAGCTFKSNSGDPAAYERILRLFKQVVPWLGGVERKASNKYHSDLVNAMYRCAVFITGKAVQFDGELVQDFCVTMAKECLESARKDFFATMVRKVCYSAPSKWEGRPSLILQMLRITLDCIVHDCEVGMVKMVHDCLAFVSYCANSILAVSLDVSKDASELLYKRGFRPRVEWLQSNVFNQAFPLTAAIFILYATGLFLDASLKSDDGSVIISLLDNEEKLQLLTESLEVLSSYFQIVSHNEPGSMVDSNVNLDFKKRRACEDLSWNDFLLSYLDGLEYLCRLLVECINTDWKHLSCEKRAIYNTVDVKHIQDTLLQFCNLVLAAINCTEVSARHTQRIKESHQTLLEVVVSALKMSLGTSGSGNLQKCSPSLECLAHVISSEWIEPQQINYLVSTLSKIGLALYEIGHLDQAVIVLKHCRKGIRKQVKLLLEMYSGKSNGFYDDEITEEKFKDTITDAYRRSGLILEILYKCGASNLHKFAVKSLTALSAVEDTFGKFSSSMALVKQWVKIMYKEFEKNDAADNVPVLYCSTWSKKMSGKILEQELLAYEIMANRNTKLCQNMRLKLVDILLKDVYITESCKAQRSWVLVKKGKDLRTRGLEGLEGCMDCLSEAISFLGDISGTSMGNATVDHQLALTYCLYAQCLQETNQDFEVILKYIELALNLWSKMGIQDSCSTDSNQLDLGLENAVPLLCNIVDLLALKGNMKYHFDLCKLIFTFCERETISREKCLAMLWTGRKLSHSLCVYPMDEDLILRILEHLNICSNSIEYWINSIEDPSSVLMFLQKFLLCETFLPDPEVSPDSSARYFSSKISIDEVKNAASSLISDLSVPLSRGDCKTAFIAGYLYHDLSERLIALGRIFEALPYAKEAHRWRQNILKRKFSPHEQKYGDLDASCLATQVKHKTFSLEAIGSVITDVWPDVSKSSNLDETITNPWSVLRCYLDSTLQVATLYESTGNGVEAESFIQTGRSISSFHGLPLYEIAFTLLLGQLYRKRQLWDLSQDRLNNAKSLLDKNDKFITCQHCKLAFGVTVDMQLGDLSRNLFEKGLQEAPAKNLSDIRGIYESALDKLNHIHKELECSNVFKEAENSQTLFRKNHTGGARYGSLENNKLPSSANSPVCRICSYLDHSSSSHCLEEKLPDTGRLLNSRSRGGGSNVDTGVKKKSRKPSNSLQMEPLLNAELKPGRTRSSNRSCNKRANVTCEVDRCYETFSSHEFCSDKPRVEKSEGKLNGSASVFGCNKECLWDRTNCWRCCLIKVSEAGRVKDIISLKWECYRRRVLLKLLLRIGRCCETPVGGQGEHIVHDVLWRCVSVLFHRQLFSQNYPVIRDFRLVKLIEEENVNDIFSTERATILYSLSWLSLKDCLSQNTRSTCCGLSEVISSVLPWLFRAFILCRELPLLFCKVSELLSTAFILSTLCGHGLLPFCSNKSLSSSHWAAYFHQASVGTYSQWDYLSYVNDMSDASKCLLSGSRVGALMEVSNFLRFAPEKPEELTKLVTDFYHGLPTIPIVCISVLGSAYVTLLGDSLLLPSSRSWMLLTRIDSKSQPIVMLLPINCIGEEHDDSFRQENNKENIRAAKSWLPPWNSTVVDYVAPSYKLILEDNAFSLSNLSASPDDAEVRNRWWSERTSLDNRLDWFLRRMEDSWLGPWSCLLLGSRPNMEYLDAPILKLTYDLSSKCNFEVNSNLMKIVLTGAKSVADAEACISQIQLYKGYFGWGSCCGKEQFRTSSSSCHEGNESVSESVRNLILEVIGDPAEIVDRESVILVLDSDVQMFPWENLPALRNQEVYRMPSVASIAIALSRNCPSNQQKKITSDDFLPSIDPFDAYYLLNPSGDLNNTQVEFEQWFRDQKLVGKSGVAPATGELVSALKDHDLFLYFGHGNGIQYIPGCEFQKLDRCAATLLMGCSSGSLYQKGCYAPQGAPLLYLLAGSPAVVANLWDVTDKDIDRFSKVILQSWLLQEEPHSPESTCNCSNGIVEDFGSMSMDGSDERSAVIFTRNKRKNRKKLGEQPQDRSGVKCKRCEGERNRRIASFMGRARDACKLPFLIGAAPVCYGVPTVLRKR